MKAILLSAGQGSRLLPLTEKIPKCLLKVGPISVLEMQIRQLRACGVRDVTVVTGYESEAVEALCAALSAPDAQVKTCFNPFYKAADNLASCWMVRHEMDGPFVLINGDTLFEAPVLERLLAAPPAPVIVAIDRKPAYDADDMKVETEGGRLLAIGKSLPPQSTTGESVGMLRFEARGASAFKTMLEEVMRRPEGLTLWFLRAIDHLAKQNLVAVCSIESGVWQEIDFVEDFAKAQEKFAVAAARLAAQGEALPACSIRV